MHTQVEEVRDQAACLLGGRAQLAPLHEVICAAGCSLVRAPPYLGGPMGLASSGDIFYWAPRMAGLACGGRIYPGPRKMAWSWRSLRRPAAAGAPTPSAPSAQREAATGLPQAPGRAARPCHRRRARSARRRWQPAAALRSARRAAPSAPSAERGARGGDQARCRRPGAQRPRHRDRCRARGAAMARADAVPTASTPVSGATTEIINKPRAGAGTPTGRLLPASATLRS